MDLNLSRFLTVTNMYNQLSLVLVYMYLGLRC